MPPKERVLDRAGLLNVPSGSLSWRQSRKPDFSPHRTDGTQDSRVGQSQDSDLCLQQFRAKGHGRIYGKNYFRVGMIINAPLHEDDYQATMPVGPDRSGVSTLLSQNTCNTKVSTNLDVNDQGQYNTHFQDITFSKHGPIHTKRRYMIIIALFGQHYLAVPLYTHGDRGIGHKHNQEEFLHVSNKGSPNGQTLVVAKWLNYTDLKDNSNVHVMRPVSRAYNLQIFHNGDLHNDSTARLLQYYYEQMCRANESWQLSEQLQAL